MNIPYSGERLNSMILDQLIMAGISFLLFLPYIIVSLAKSFAVEHEPELMSISGPILFNLGLSGIILYFCKDSINGRSWGKRKSGLQVVHYKTGNPASPMRCFVRNLTAFIFYIEFIVALANPERRIGDYLAGTKIVRYDPTSEPLKVNRSQLTLTVLMACSFLVFFFPYDVTNWKNKVSLGASVVPESLNDAKGRDLETFLLDSMGYEYKADIRIYDQLKENKDIQFISALITKIGNNEGTPDSVATAEIQRITSLIDLKYDSTAWRRLVFSGFRGSSIHLGANQRIYNGLAKDKRWYRFWHQIPAACEGPCE
mgnify:CR=1 FL=1